MSESPEISENPIPPSTGRGQQSTVTPYQDNDRVQACRRLDARYRRHQHWGTDQLCVPTPSKGARMARRSHEPTCGRRHQRPTRNSLCQLSNPRQPDGL